MNYGFSGFSDAPFEVDVVEELASLTESLAQTVARNAPDELIAIVERQRELSDRLSRLRRAGVEAAGDERLEVAGMSEPGNAFVEGLARLVELNHRNLTLLGGAVASMRSYLAFLSGLGSSRRTYGGDGQWREQPGERRRAVDRRA